MTTSTLRARLFGKRSAPHDTFSTRTASPEQFISPTFNSTFRLRRSTTASLLSVMITSLHTRPARRAGTPMPAPNSRTLEEVSNCLPLEDRMNSHRTGIACHATCPVSSCLAVDVSSGKTAARSARTTTCADGARERRNSAGNRTTYLLVFALRAVREDVFDGDGRHDVSTYFTASA